MKVFIFNFVEETVCAEHGAESWDELLEDAGMEGVYSTLNT